MKVLLRELQEKDAEISWKWRNDPEVWKLTGRKWNNYVTHEIEKEWIRKVKDENDSIRFAICVDEENEYVGNVQLTNIEGGTAVFHIFIGNKNFWGKGIGKEDTKLLIEHAKSLKELKKISLLVKVDNKAAFKIYENIGFIVQKEDSENISMTYEL